MLPHTRTSIRVRLLAGLLSAIACSACLGFQTDAWAQEKTPARTPAKEAAAAAGQEQERAQSIEELREQEAVNREMIRVRQRVTQEMLGRLGEGRKSQFQQILGDLGAFLIFSTILGSLLWIFRVVLDARRWNKIARVQYEVHTKLLEKFASSGEILGYMNTEAGKRFLESAPFEIEGRRSTPFPYGRILWSVQVGVILALVGVGLIYLRAAVPEAAQPLLVFGTLALTLGIGFALSAGVSYLLSRSFGLLQDAPRSSSTPGNLTATRP